LTLSGTQCGSDQGDDGEAMTRSGRCTAIE
jgi:hypothetical protein